MMDNLGKTVDVGNVRVAYKPQTAGLEAKVTEAVDKVKPFYVDLVKEAPKDTLVIVAEHGDEAWSRVFTSIGGKLESSAVMRDTGKKAIENVVWQAFDMLKDMLRGAVRKVA